MKKIYLAGSVPKGEEELDKFVNWREGYEKVLEKFFDCKCIDPFARDLNEEDLTAVFGFDCEHIQNCDFLVVNASERLGVGTSQEMVIAKYFEKPVVTVLPKETYQRRTNVEINGKLVKEWIHPFLKAFSDFIIEDIEEIEQIKNDILSGKTKTLSVIDESIEYFEESSGQK